nr:hypothetical protein [uncultured Duganella sp.]
MTSSDQKMHDDELDEFLAGRDALSRQLAALPQPASPKTVDDAVMAAITARLAQEQAARSAQQGIAPAAAAEITQVAPPRTTAANMGRWRAPAALAASLVGALLLTLEWQRGDYYVQPAPAVAPEPTQSAATPPPKPMPAAKERALQSAEPAIPTAPAAAKSRPPAPAHPALPAPLIAKPAIPALAESADKTIQPQAEAMALNRRSSVAAPVITLPAPAPPAPVAPLSFTARATSVPPGQIIALAPPAPPAPTAITVTGAARKAAPAADDARAADWLNVINEMLKADLRKDAIDEWRKFRVAYPDYPVPEDLARQIAAID